MAKVLVGRYLSPWVRRVGVTMHLQGMAYEHRPISALKDPAAPFAYNPIGRVPALVLESGESLIDSNAICDWLDEEAGAEKRLLPVSGPERRRCQQTIALMAGALEKSIAAIYERVKRPEDKWHTPWIEQLEKQVVGGVQSVEEITPQSGWFGGEHMNAADVLVGCGFRFIAVGMVKHLAPAGRFPRLEAYSARCEALPAFRACQLET